MDLESTLDMGFLLFPWVFPGGGLLKSSGDEVFFFGTSCDLFSVLKEEVVVSVKELSRLSLPSPAPHFPPRSGRVGIRVC